MRRIAAALLAAAALTAPACKPADLTQKDGGSGPAQLALALLADHLGNDEQALAVYQRFKWAVIAKLPKHAWKLTSRMPLRTAMPNSVTNPTMLAIEMTGA